MGHNTSGKTHRIRLWAALFWLAVWEFASRLIHKQIILVSPIRAFVRLGELVPEAAFWRSVLYSFLRICGGYLLALLCGVLFATLAARFRRVRELLAPLMLAIRSVPVASFIILALILMPSRHLSIFISFLMVLPILYSNLLEGIGSMDRGLLEMAEVFRIPPVRRVRYLFFPAVYPYLLAGCSTGAGLAWKSGIAAEVIGMPRGSIGERLQQAKVYLDTPDLFAWTIVIVVLSLLFEKTVLALLRLARTRLADVSIPRGSGAVQTQSEKKEPAPIRLEHLTMRYGENLVLDDFSAQISGTGATALMGASGAGKTTLTRLILGLERPESGRILLPSGLRVAAVFQDDLLCPDLGAAGNVRLVSPRIPQQRLEEAFAAVELPLHTPESSGAVSGFSGGMKRRVAILRALLSDWDLLILDEPFRGLDPGTRESVIRCILRLAGPRPILLVTHDASEADRMQCGSVIRLPEEQR